MLWTWGGGRLALTVICYMPCTIKGSPGGSFGQESSCNAGDLSLIPGFGRSPGKGSGNPLQYSCLGNPVDRGACRAMVHGVSRVEIDFGTKINTTMHC